MRFEAITGAILSVVLLTGPAHAILIPLDEALIVSPSSPGAYTEVGDAGDRFSPQAITGVDVTGIAGDIGSAGDPVDAFKFFFAGGDVVFVGTALVGPGLIPLPLSLFFPPDPVFPPDPITPDTTGPGTIGFFGLAAGDYIIEATFLADPPFSIGVFTLNPDGSLGPPTIILPPRVTVPAPASALLLTLGIAGLWRASRRRLR
jgi:hypothetical protein